MDKQELLTVISDATIGKKDPTDGTRKDLNLTPRHIEQIADHLVYMLEGQPMGKAALRSYIRHLAWNCPNNHSQITNDEQYRAVGLKIYSKLGIPAEYQHVDIELAKIQFRLISYNYTTNFPLRQVRIDNWFYRNSLAIASAMPGTLMNRVATTNESYIPIRRVVHAVADNNMRFFAGLMSWDGNKTFRIPSEYIVEERLCYLLDAVNSSWTLINEYGIDDREGITEAVKVEYELKRRGELRRQSSFEYMVAAATGKKANTLEFEVRALIKKRYYEKLISRLKDSPTSRSASNMMFIRAEAVHEVVKELGL